MIDLHAQSLPGLDDGARSLDEALAMARDWVASGVTIVACTPHSDPQLTRTLVETALQRFQADLDTADIPLHLALGVEALLQADMDAALDAGYAYPLADTTYTLVELRRDTWPDYLNSALDQLQQRGLIPILAHPEQYQVVQHNPDLVTPLVERGVLMQVTAGSLIGLLGSAAQMTAETLLRRGQCHLLATDSHRPTLFPPSLRAGYQAATHLIGGEAAHRLVMDIPAAILANRAIPIWSPLPLGEG